MPRALCVVDPDGVALLTRTYGDASPPSRPTAALLSAVSAFAAHAGGSLDRASTRDVRVVFHRARRLGGCSLVVVASRETGDDEAHLRWVLRRVEDAVVLARGPDATRDAAASLKIALRRATPRVDAIAAEASVFASYRAELQLGPSPRCAWSDAFDVAHDLARVAEVDAVAIVAVATGGGTRAAVAAVVAASRAWRALPTRDRVALQALLSSRALGEEEDDASVDAWLPIDGGDGGGGGGGGGGGPRRLTTCRLSRRRERGVDVDFRAAFLTAASGGDGDGTTPSRDRLRELARACEGRIDDDALVAAARCVAGGGGGGEGTEEGEGGGGGGGDAPSTSTATATRADATALVDGVGGRVWTSSATREGGDALARFALATAPLVRGTATDDDDDDDGDDGTERGRLPSGAVARAARGKADGARFAAARGERGYVGYVARGEDADGDGVVELAREVAAAGAA